MGASAAGFSTPDPGEGAAWPRAFPRRARWRITLLVAPFALLACRASAPRAPAVPGAPPSAPAPAEPAGAPPAGDPELLPVRKAGVEIVVAAWAEPSHLGPGGGEAQILVRVQRRGGTPLAGVEVRLSASHGALYSGGRVLTTDARGMTRDRLTTRRTGSVTLNAGGTRYRFEVPVERKQ